LSCSVWCCSRWGVWWAACSTSIYWLIAGRFLQGCGAVSSALMALVADLTREQYRTRAMAAVGASIGLAFMLAMMMGPILAARIGLSGLFWLTAVLAVAGILLMVWVVPDPAPDVAARSHLDTVPAISMLKCALLDSGLARLNLGVFVLHAILMALFTLVPPLLESQLGLARGQHWEVYLPVLVGSFFAMIPVMVLAERYRQVRWAFRIAIGSLIIALALMGLAYQQEGMLVLGLSVFFFGFNLLEAQLPSLVSKQAFPGGRGTAMGLFSTCQFLGIFFGGMLGGWMQHIGDKADLFWALATLALIWLLVANGMQEPSGRDEVQPPVV
jgi:predicted MFS family arabinose efflux permease